ncbi:MAG: hypothetical protein K6F50_00385 [Kiritimatiellae bacterium]|nr:hypothetical protein [Kiritimatiellia bacterium]
MKTDKLSLFVLAALACGSLFASAWVTSNGDAKRYNTLDEALAAATALTNSSTVAVIGDDTISSSFTITNGMEICGDSVLIGNGGSLTVSGGATLVFSNITFSSSPFGIRTTPFVIVESGSSVELENGFSITKMGLNSNTDGVRFGCAFRVAAGGSISMEDGASISGCRQASQQNSTNVKTCGGAVWLDSGSMFEFAGGSITNCFVAGYGGAVYVSSNAEVRISGAAVANGNKANHGSASSASVADDICVASGGSLTVAGALSGGEDSIGVAVADSPNVGDAFAALADGASADEATLAAFVNNSDGSLLASVSGLSLVWKEEDSEDTPAGPQPVGKSAAAVMLANGDGTKYYATLEDGFGAATNGTATITLLKSVEFTNSVSLASNVTLVDVTTNRFAVTRPADGTALIDVGAHSLAVTNVTLTGGVGRFLNVKGGSLTLDADSEVCYVYGRGSAFVAPVTVWGGTFTMNGNASIFYCMNSFNRKYGNSLAAGGVVVAGSETAGAKAVMNGGRICGCRATGAGFGGIYIGNQAEIEVKGGECMIWDNTTADVFASNRARSNLTVHDLSSHTLTGALTGNAQIGFMEGILADTNTFGATTLSGAAAVQSAARYIHDSTGAAGEVDGKTLIWDPSVDPSVVADVCGPFAFTAIEENDDGAWLLTIAPAAAGCTYTLYASDDLSVDLQKWTQAGEPQTPTASGEISFTVPGDTAQRFWRAIGTDAY